MKEFLRSNVMPLDKDLQSIQEMCELVQKAKQCVIVDM